MRRKRWPLAKAGGVLLILASGWLQSAAAEDGPARGFEAHYHVSLAGVTIGKGSWVAEITDDRYTTAATGQVTGILRAFGSANGSATARGAMKDGRPVPTDYAGHLISDDGDEQVRMSLDSGTVTALSSVSPVPATDRVPVTDADRRGVIDPISAGLIATAGDGESMSATACERTLAVFDGRQRFDIALSFKRLDAVAPEVGYHGPALVCAVRYLPLAGYRRDHFAVKYLSEARDVEMWLIPVIGTRILMPARVLIPTLIGTAVVEAHMLGNFTKTPLANTAAKGH